MRLQALSEIIRYHRASLKMDRNAYARNVGMSSKAIKALEQGAVRNPHIKTMDKLSAFMGRPKADLWAALRREEARETNGD